MGTPTTRTPVRIGRGTYSNLNSSKADILEGEVVYATDQNKLYVKEGSNLESVQIDASLYATLAGSTFTDNIVVDNQKELRFEEATANGNNYVGFEAPATLGGDQIWVLPTADGSAGQLLKTDGSGNLGWATDSTTDATKMPLAGGTFTGDVSIDNQKDLRFEEATANGDHYVAFQAPASLAANVTWTLPTADSSGSQALVSNGSGTLSWSTTGDAVLANHNNWTGAQRGNITTLTSSANITINMSTTNNYSVVLAHNTAFENPTYQVAGQSGSIFIKQDGTGSRTASWKADWKWKGGTAPTLTTTAGAYDRVDYIILEDGKIHAVATLDVK